MDYSLGIDLGTSYFKFGLFDGDDKSCGLSRVEVEKDVGEGNLCQVPAERFIGYIKDGIARACSNAKISPACISKIGYSSQANSFILLDKKDCPLTELILWPDRRSPEIFPQVKELWTLPEFHQTTGMGIDASANLCVNKLLWLRANRPEVWEKVKSVMTISDYLTFLFTGERIGDLGTASLLGLLDCKNSKYWLNAFEILELDKSVFSKRCRVGTKIENVTGEIAKQIGIKDTTCFHIGSLDHHMAAVGAGVGEIAEMSESTGTVLACVNFANKYNPAKDVCISPWKDGKFCQLAFDENGALSLEWYQKNFANQYTLEELVIMAEVVNSPEGLTANRMAFRHETIDKAFNNIQKHHSHGHFIRALMVSSAQSLSELINKISPDRKPEKIVSTGGGAKSDLWLEIKSNLTGSKFIKSNLEEPACHGAASV